MEILWYWVQSRWYLEFVGTFQQWIRCRCISFEASLGTVQAVHNFGLVYWSIMSVANVCHMCLVMQQTSLKCPFSVREQAITTPCKRL